MSAQGNTQRAPSSARGFSPGVLACTTSATGVTPVRPSPDVPARSRRGVPQ